MEITPENIAPIDDNISNDTVAQNKKTVNISNDVENLIKTTPQNTSGAEIPASPSGKIPHGQETPIKKSVGRPKKNRPQVSEPEHTAQPQPAPSQTKPTTAQQARMLNQGYETALVAFLGDDAKLEEGEKICLDGALAEYMTHKNMDIPVGVALAFAYATVTGSKIQKPKPKERVRTIWGAVKMKFGRNKLKEKQETNEG